MSSNISITRICKYCEQAFQAKTTHTKYCSHICNSRDYKRNNKGCKIEKSNLETKAKLAPEIEAIKTAVFLSVKDASFLLKISTKTLYRLIERKELKAHNFSERKTLIRRKDLDDYFDELYNVEVPPTRDEITLSNSYTMEEIIEKFGISNGALYNLIDRFKIPKRRQGKYMLVRKDDINEILT